MKIAVVTDDGAVVSAHFGQAAYLAVFTVEDGQVTEREMRDKPHHGADHDHHHDHNGGQHHGGGLFQQILPVLQDCQVLIGRGMGQPAFAKLQQAGIEPILTDIRDVDTAVQAYLDGAITSNPKRVHQH
ncbi:MAG: dinitrogenase iron-molybdenum cofactor biosynthesis protein [Chloroflexi bacterium]|nr:dinitrogenase iron-molybdenum cofactor biosynthesis protein [Chloroflexota bacterium]